MNHHHHLMPSAFAGAAEIAAIAMAAVAAAGDGLERELIACRKPFPH